VSFEAFGVNVEVALGDPELETNVREILPPGFRECAPAASAGRFGLWQTDEDTYEVTFDGAPGLEHATRAVALTLLDTEIRLHIAAHARDWIFVHAGVVARDGRALVIPGESFCGKTTLVSALVNAGATYYSDEYAVLDEAGFVHPYPRPLSIRRTDGVTARERVIARRRGVVGDERAALAAVVITRYRPGIQWQPRRLSRGQGMVALLGNTVPAQERPEQSLRTLSRAVAGATMLGGDRGEAGPVASALLDELAALAR
jgi:hypothetical protein